MHGCGMLLGFVLFVLPQVAWNWLMGYERCPLCRGLKIMNRGIDYPGEFIPCPACGGKGRTKQK